jgi:hypothetical protein
MEPHREEQRAPPPGAEPKPKRFRIVKEERFRIVKLEERIAPKKVTSGGPTCPTPGTSGCDTVCGCYGTTMW